MLFDKYNSNITIWNYCIFACEKKYFDLLEREYYINVRSNVEYPKAPRACIEINKKLFFPPLTSQNKKPIQH
jgi:hypothetical protein